MSYGRLPCPDTPTTDWAWCCSIDTIPIVLELSIIILFSIPAHLQTAVFLADTDWAENKAKDTKKNPISDTSDEEKKHQLFQATVTVLQSMPAVAYCEAYKQKHHADTRPE